MYYTVKRAIYRAPEARKTEVGLDDVDVVRYGSKYIHSMALKALLRLNIQNDD